MFGKIRSYLSSQRNEFRKIHSAHEYHQMVSKKKLVSGPLRNSIRLRAEQSRFVQIERG